MSNRLIAILDIRNDLASTQALIDRARAHLDANSHMLDEAQASLFRKGLDERQVKLDRAKAAVNARFPQS